jgi:hemin uptake protein HemP
MYAAPPPATPDPWPVAADMTSSDAAGPRHSPLVSADLLQGRREVLIQHGGETYRLRHTRNDKLILTK